MLKAIEANLLADVECAAKKWETAYATRMLQIEEETSEESEEQIRAALSSFREQISSRR